MAISEKGRNQYDKEYEAFRIFEQIQIPEEAPMRPLAQETSADESLQSEDIYCEIEYDSAPASGDGTKEAHFSHRYVLEPDRIEQRPKDEIREHFNRMRDIARENRYLNFGSRKFFDRKIQQDNARIFYRQGIMMKDFEDEYEKVVPYSAYFPDYQMMGYDQLRTYFTWRAQIRQGNITQISLSYAFLYLYELLNNIGVDNPQEGLERLLLFWDAFRVYDESVDKYVLQWLKDYYIYYGLDGTFQEFVSENALEAYYPNLADSEDEFDLFCSVSKYEIKKSAFYTNETRELIRKCFNFVCERLRKSFEEKQKVFDEFVFCPVRNMAVWMPFKGALFYPVLRQPDRRVVLSRREIYVCSGNQWTFSAVITAESGKQLVGFVMKQTEALLRKLMNYKYKLTASVKMLSPVMADELDKAGIHLEKLVEDAVRAFYREETRTVVRVNPGELEKIRREALVIQEKLTVQEEDMSQVMLVGGTEEGPVLAVSTGGTEEGPVLAVSAGGTKGESSDLMMSVGGTEETVSAKSGSEMWEDGIAGPWEALRSNLTDIEVEALTMLSRGESEIRQLADEYDIMFEVLIDGINEKAMDCIGDSILDGEAVLYDDYAQQVKEMVEVR